MPTGASLDPPELEIALAPWRARFVHQPLGGYFDTASHAPQAVDHERALAAYLASWRAGAAPWATVWQDVRDEVAERTATLLCADPAGIALVPTASHALLGVLSALEPIASRDAVVIGAHEWISNHHVLAADRRFRRVVVPAGDDLVASIDERTRLVVVSRVCYRTGAHADVRRIVDRAHEVGALVYLDAFQAAGAIALDLVADGVDFAAGGYLKHLLGGPGLAWVYVRPAWAESVMPRLTGWRGQRDPMQPTLDPAPAARRFETGTWPIPSLYLARAGLDLIDRAGLRLIAAHVAHLTRRFASGAEAAGFEMLTPTSAAGVGPLVVLRAPDANAIRTAVAAHGITLTARDGTLRASLHAHLRASDVDAAVAAVAAARRQRPEDVHA